MPCLAHVLVNFKNEPKIKFMLLCKNKNKHKYYMSKFCSYDSLKKHPFSDRGIYLDAFRPFVSSL